MDFKKRVECQSISTIKGKAASCAADGMANRLDGQVMNSEAGRPTGQTDGLVGQQEAGRRTERVGEPEGQRMEEVVYRPISEEELDMEMLREAAREGRLFLSIPKEEGQEMSPQGKEERPPMQQATGEKGQLSPEQVREEILDYVERIRPYAACTEVRAIWQAILQDEVLFPLFRFTRYAQSRGRINWYRVTVVMCQLYEQGVYRHEVSAVNLHCCLEGTKRRNARYTGMGRYLLERQQSKRIQQIVRQFGR